MVTDQFETGAFVQSYKSVWQHLDTAQQVIAIETFHNFLDESRYDFDADIYVETFDVSDVEWNATGQDEWDVDFPIPKKNIMRARHLWVAALELCKMENIQEKIIVDAAEEDAAMGERETVVGVSDDGKVVTDMEEHHLNLPLSRLIKDHNRLLEIGGVEYGSNQSDLNINVGGDRGWVTTIEEPDEPTPETISEEDPFDANVNE